MNSLILSNVEIKYLGVILVIKGISIEIPEGGMIALLGANGAGKTTTLKAISGLLRTEGGNVTDGKIEFLGERIDKKEPEEIFDMGIVQVMEGRRIFKYLTAEENLLVGTSRNLNLNERLELIYHYFPPLKDHRKNISGYLSGGEQQMLVIGRALIVRPKLILLDEPSLGLSPILTKQIFNIIRSINLEQKTSILLVEQNVRDSLSLASYGYVLETGKIVLEGSASDLIENPDIKEFYLGISKSGDNRRSYRDVRHYKGRKRWTG
jgi:branched-chain amino acid transport system ATP-binding protein